MKKKIAKKLALSKETLRTLSAMDLRGVAGGGISGTSCDTEYPCENQFTQETAICG